MADRSTILSADAEEKLLQPIEEYVGKIQAQIDELRVEGSDKVRSLKNHIAIAKEDKNLSKDERDRMIAKDKADLEKAKAVEASNKDKVAKLVKEAEDYLAQYYDKDYYDKVAASCAAEKAIENEEYEKVRATIKTEHEQNLKKLSAAEDIKDEKYVYKNKLFDAEMAHESKLQEIKDRRHDAFAHKYHLIDLLRMSKYTFGQKMAQRFENYKYTFNTAQFLYKNGLYIVIILIFIALCIITPIVKNTQLFTYTNILNILQQASPRMFLALGVAGLILLTGTDLSVVALMRGPILKTISLMDISRPLSPQISMIDFKPMLGLELSSFRPWKARMRFSSTTGTMSAAMLTAQKSSRGMSREKGIPLSLAKACMNLKPTPHPQRCLNGKGSSGCLGLSMATAGGITSSGTW